MKRAFIAGNHKAWFSTLHKELTVNEVLEKDPTYLNWCLDNLKHLRFATSLKERIKNKSTPVDAEEKNR